MKRSLILLLTLGTLAALLPSNLFAFGQNKIVYDKFNWNIYHATHFDVYFYDEEKPSLQRVVDVAESAYDDLSRKFNHQVTKKIPLIYYATHSAFEQTNVDLTFIPEGVGAFAEPVRNRMVIPIDTSDEKLLQLVTHELTHVFEYDILFQGKLGKSLTSNPPTWFMEGLASYMGNDEDSRDRMVLRDAVVNDNLPPLERVPGGYFAYRYGHAIFKYIQQRYGDEGVRDFIYEYRNTLGSNVAKALKRSFDVTVEEFNSHFRTWLRKQYLPALISRGEPSEYGDPFRIEPQRDQGDAQTSPAIAPSGDLLASFTTYAQDADIALFNVPERKLLRNLSKGYTTKYEYLIAQWLTIGPIMGRDLAFSPDGDHVAAFVKKERGRNLLIINALSGRMENLIPLPVEQQLNPSFSPDGRKIVFSGIVSNQTDLFVYDLDSHSLTNVTNDHFFDGSPVYSPDGKSIIYSSVVDGYAKLFRLDLADPSKRYQLTTGPFNDTDATFSPDGKRIFFSSDRQTGRNIETASIVLEKAENAARREGNTPPADPTNFAAYNIYSLNLTTGDLLQFTDVVGGCFSPAVFLGEGGKERMVFAAYYKQRFRLYSSLTDKPLHAAEKVTLPSGPTNQTRSTFLPPVEVAIDPEKIDKPGHFKLFIDDVQVNAGVDSNQTVVSRSVIYMSDMLGDRRFVASLDSVSTFSNFDFLYLDMRKRLNWGVRLFDDRSFYLGQDTGTGGLKRDRQAYRETGALGILSYSFNRYHRLDTGAGYVARSANYPVMDGAGNVFFIGQSDSYPLITSTFSGDTTAFREFGPSAGHRYDVTGSYAIDTKNSGSLTHDVIVDARQYIPLTQRSLIAARVFAGWAGGNRPDLFYFGGLNTLRGYEFREFVGTRAAYANVELRFPLIDALVTPIGVFQQMRGSFFFDIGAAALQNQAFQFYHGGHLQDARASFGYGFSMNLLGLELHWDFARRTDLKTVDKGYRTTFWIGETF